MFTFTQPTPAEALGSTEAKQRAGETAGMDLFLVDKIKDALVALHRCGRHGELQMQLSAIIVPPGLLVAF